METSTVSPSKPTTEERSPRKIRRIITHFRPHLDEIFAIMLLMRLGNKLFPGIENATVEYCGTGRQPEDKTAEQHLAEGTLLIGLGGGMFDEHPNIDGKKRDKGQSACSLVAKHLGIEKHILYKKLLNEVTKSDLGEEVSLLHTANEIKRLYRRYPENPQVAIDAAKDFLRNALWEQQVFMDALKVCREADKIGPANNVSGINIAYIESDNFALMAAARYSGKIDVLIQSHPSTGHVQIFCTSRKKSLQMDMVVAALRCAEMGIDIEDQTKAYIIELRQEGKFGTEIWFYQIPGGNILNGSETTPGAKATRLKGREIFKIVQEYIRLDGKKK